MPCKRASQDIRGPLPKVLIRLVLRYLAEVFSGYLKMSMIVKIGLPSNTNSISHKISTLMEMSTGVMRCLSYLSLSIKKRGKSKWLLRHQSSNISIEEIKIRRSILSDRKTMGNHLLLQSSKLVISSPGRKLSISWEVERSFSVGGWWNRFPSYHSHKNKCRILTRD